MADRMPLISGNWKMHHNHFEAIQTVQKLSYLLTKEDYLSVEVSVHPPFTDIRSVQTVIESDDIPMALGAQHCHWEEKGAYTGEVSPHFLAKLNVQYVIVGHSERREIFGETDEMVAKKITAIQNLGMKPIVCVGETLEEREAGQTNDKVLGQLMTVLEGRTAEHVKEMVIAYEPIWAIGTGRTATSQDAQEVCAAIRQKIAEAVGKEAAQAVRIQYGGSVKGANAQELMAMPDIDGALVGGASLLPDDFAQIVQYRLRAS
jgi:triosephosphate isomerase (TIM)